jgi:choline dehydrogenase-like flavoprotein
MFAEGQYSPRHCSLLFLNEPMLMFDVKKQFSDFVYAATLLCKVSDRSRLMRFSHPQYPRKLAAAFGIVHPGAMQHADQVFELPPFPNTHNMGTCRQSGSARDGVCNKYGQTHDIANLFISDGSQFTSAGAENPTLTIVALAVRQADYLADQLGKKQI